MEESITRTRRIKVGSLTGVIEETDGIVVSVVIRADTEGRGLKHITIKDRWSDSLGLSIELSDLLELVTKMMEEV